MDKVFDRVRGRVKELLAQVESARKGISYRADLAVRNVAKLVEGFFHGQQRR
jgi:hypothetical protein